MSSSSSHHHHKQQEQHRRRRQRRGMGGGLLLGVGLMASSARAAAGALVSYNVGAVDGSALLGTALLTAGDKLSLLRAAGLANKNLSAEEVATPDSPYTDFDAVTDASDGLLSDYQDGSAGLPQDWALCAASLQSSGSAMSQTWAQGASTTTQGAAAVQHVQGNVDQMSGLAPAEKEAALATLAAYDTYVKNGGGRRALQRRRQQALGGASSSLAPLLGTYSTLKPYVSQDCTSLFRELVMERIKNGESPAEGLSGGQNGGGMPGGAPGGGEGMQNPFPGPGTSMSGQDQPPDPFSGATDIAGEDGAGGSDPLKDATTTAGQDGTTATEEDPAVAEQGTNRCKTFSSGKVGVQLCQGTTVTETSATVTGSIINVGEETLCGLKLIVDSFELASDFYPKWLPEYDGLFEPGDTITFGVTVPYTAAAARPQADVDSGIAACAPPSASPTAAPPLATSAPSSAAAQAEAAASTRPTIDWLTIGGLDARCLKGCLTLVEGLTACEGFDAIGSFRCDVCDASQYAAVKDVCMTQYQCGEKMCHVEPVVPTQSSGAGSLGQSVKTSLSLLLGFVTVLLVLNMGL